MLATKLRTVSVTTSYVALADIRCQQVQLINNTAAALLVRMESETQTGESISLAVAQSVTINVAQSAKEIAISAAAGAAGVQLIFN